MLLRGLFRRCPWCGGRGAFYTGWTSKADACQSCGLEWRRDDVGYELGAAATAAIICLGPLVLTLGAVTALTWPDFRPALLVGILGIGVVVLPILLYSSSYTMWQAVDILMRPVEPGDFTGTVGLGQPSAVDSSSETSAPARHGGGAASSASAQDFGQRGE